MTIPYPPRREQECGNCRYWVKDFLPDDYKGHCHRHAPALTTGDWLFPATNSPDWCGEWAPQEDQ